MSPELTLARAWHAASGLRVANGFRTVEHSFPGGTLNDDAVLSFGGGEVHASFRTLLHRFVRSVLYAPGTGSTAVTAGAFRGSLPAPILWPQHGSSVGNNTAYVTFIGVIMSCFYAWRGSIRQQVQPMQLNTPSAWDDATFTLGRLPHGASTGSGLPVITQYSTASVYSQADYWDFTDTGAEVTVGRGHPPATASVEIPHFANFGVITPNTVPDATPDISMFYLTGYVGEPRYLAMKVWEAAGDDIQFFGWCGPPTVTAVSGAYSSGTWTSW